MRERQIQQSSRTEPSAKNGRKCGGNTTTSSMADENANLDDEDGDDVDDGIRCCLIFGVGVDVDVVVVVDVHNAGKPAVHSTCAKRPHWRHTWHCVSGVTNDAHTPHHDGNACRCASNACSNDILSTLTLAFFCEACFFLCADVKKDQNLKLI